MCPLCKGNLKEELITFTIDKGDTLVIIKNVPANVCTQCGESYFNDEVSQNIEALMSTRKTDALELEVIKYVA